MSRARVEVAVPVRAPAGAVWDAVTDWPAQGEWMTATRVRAVDGDGRGVGGRIEAFTGFGRFGFLDTMVVTHWQPPGRCAVLHTGRVVRGTGEFAVEEAPGPDPSHGGVGAPSVRLVWREELDLPGGVVARLGWQFVRPLVRLFVGRSLARLARSVEHGARRGQPGDGGEGGDGDEARWQG